MRVGPEASLFKEFCSFVVSQPIRNVLLKMRYHNASSHASGMQVIDLIVDIPTGMKVQASAPTSNTVMHVRE